MPERDGFTKGMRVALLRALFVVIVVAPLIGVYAFSPILFVWGIDPYQLAVALGVMLAEAVAAAVLYLLVFHSRR